MSAIRLRIPIVIVTLWLLVGCSVRGSFVELTARCLNALTSDAVRIGGDSDLNAQWGARLGLETQRTNPYRFKALHAPASGGLRFFGVASTDWTKALLVHYAGPGTELFVIDRTGRLLAAGRVSNGSFNTIGIDVPAVRDAFHTEVSNWREAARITPATSEACR